MTTVTELRRELELRRLAQELATTPDTLPGFDEVDPDDLAHLRRQLASGLVRRHGPLFDAFAQASTMVPASLAASITRRMIGPALAGRMAGSMTGQRAAAVMAHLDTDFLADACHTLTIEAATKLLPAIDDAQVVATTRELARRDDHATLGRFVDVLDQARLRTVLGAIDDPRDLLLAGAASDSAAALDRVVAMLPPPRRASVVRLVPEHPEAAANILLRVTPQSRGLLLDAVADLDDEDLVALLDGCADAVRRSPALRTVGAGLPGPELAAAAGRLGRTEPLERAIGRLAMTVLDLEKTS